MTDLTLGIIYAIKIGENDSKENIIDFLSKYTGTPKDYYTDKKVRALVRDSFIDYLKSSDNPDYDVWQYFEHKRQQENFMMIYPEQYQKSVANNDLMDVDTEAIIVALQLTTVFENGKYINGFRSFTYE